MNKQPGDAPLLNILVVDDVAETRQSARLIVSLIPDARVVAEAANGREAVAQAQKHRPDVVLMDINMPEMDGLTAIEIIRRELPRTICIVVSAEKDSETLKRAIAVGVHGYLLKPFDGEQVASVLARSRKALGKAAASPPSPRPPQPQPTPEERQRQLETLAAKFIRERRTDATALKVFELLARQPRCPRPWLHHLALLYVLRREWRKLKLLAEYLERRGET